MIRTPSLFLLAFLAVSCAGGGGRSELSPKGKEGEAVEKKTTTAEDTAEPPEEWLTYRIPEGEHGNQLKSFQFFNGDTLSFRFAFDSTAVYQTKDPVNQHDWNKLLGFSDCGSFHHENSIRFVWRYTGNGIVEIGEYRYQSAERMFSTIGSAAIGDTVFARLTAEEDYYTMTLDDLRLELPRNSNSRLGSYWLYPYFGGDEVAPHEINVHVQHLIP